MKHRWTMTAWRALSAVSAICVVVLAGSMAPALYAESNPAVASLRILVWPEYDDPRVLVQYEGELTEKTGFPRDLTLFVPAGASIYATAYADDGGNLINTEPAKLQEAADGFARMTVKLPTARFHFEYYYNPLPATADKTMEFVYKAAQATGRVRLEIQQPLKAEKFTTDPPAATQTSGNHDFKYHLFDYPAMNADQVLRVKVQYTKTDPNPSVVNVAQTLPQTANAPAAESSNPLNVLPYVIGAAALAMGALAFFAWYSRRQPVMHTAPAHSRPRRKWRQHSSAYFCPKCGNELDEDDNFCAVCGAKRRT